MGMPDDQHNSLFLNPDQIEFPRGISDVVIKYGLSRIEI